LNFYGLFNWILENTFGFGQDWIWIDIKTYQSIAEAKMGQIQLLHNSKTALYSVCCNYGNIKKNT